ncbi:hemin uptake protein HemP [Dyella soli]|uniref:Hemin uptake protein HemP n=1 Tax=Dyella soli TaxID=522319 RepID=A0A4R0YYB9_9GAMM|nr:hemin uptake protein HemP [Dyella soli]
MPVPGLKPATIAGLGAVRRVSSQLLLKGERELVIQHQGNEYHLRLTRNDKLILTK